MREDHVAGKRPKAVTPSTLSQLAAGGLDSPHLAG